MMHMIVKLFKELFNLCLLRGSPAFLPSSQAIVGVLLLIILSLDMMSYRQIPNVSWFESIVAALLSRAVLLSLLYALLAQKKYQIRFNKTVIGFLGTMLLLSSISELILLIVPSQEIQNITLVFSFWIMLAGAHVLKLALESKTTTGLLMTFGLHFAAFLATCLVIGAQIKAQIPVNPAL